MENFVIGFVAGILLGFILMFGVDRGAKNVIRQEAVRSGAAHYIITNPVTGQTKFQWINQTNQPAQ
jgi:hypothetical protein